MLDFVLLRKRRRREHTGDRGHGDIEMFEQCLHLARRTRHQRDRAAFMFKKKSRR